MQLFRIKKESDSVYRLAKKLPESIFGKDVWDTEKKAFASALEAKAFAHELVMPEDSDIVEEFAI